MMSLTNGTTDTNQEFDPRELIALLSEQNELYGQLERLAERQRSVITGDHPEQLLTILSKRQAILDRLGTTSGALRPYQENWRDVRTRLDPTDGDVVDQLVKDMNTRLTSILQSDDTDAQLLAVRRSVTSNAMHAVKAGRKADQAYASAGREAGGRTGTEWAEA